MQEVQSEQGWVIMPSTHEEFLSNLRILQEHAERLHGNEDLYKEAAHQIGRFTTFFCPKERDGAQHLLEQVFGGECPGQQLSGGIERLIASAREVGSLALRSSPDPFRRSNSLLPPFLRD